MVNVEIDRDSGFCFGVVTAIRKAEEVLDSSGSLYCLGDIVHNAREVERLCCKGLRTITHEDLAELHDVKVLLRAHGEPPATYETARRNGVEVVDATCPVVLQLQRRIKQAYDRGRALSESGGEAPLIVIYGKKGHAEVNGLVGQTEGSAMVVENIEELDRVDFSRDILLYSQTTKSLEGFRAIVEAMQRRCRGRFEYFDTICRQVSNRMEKMKAFAMSHEAVLFVCGAKSSNGRVLYETCRRENPLTYMVGDVDGVDLEKLRGVKSVGITGATSTPLWLMEKISGYVKEKLNSDDKAEG